MSMIVIAALALVVLVVVFFIVSGRLNIFGTELNKCPGVCYAPAGPAEFNGCFNNGQLRLEGEYTDCSDKIGQVCCQQAFGGGAGITTGTPVRR